MTEATLDAFLESRSAGDRRARAVAETVRALAAGALRVRALLAQGTPASLGAVRGGRNGGGDQPLELDAAADDIFLDAARRSPVAVYASEELDQPALLDPSAPLALAIDPLDGSSNLELDISVGTIFSILPAAGDPSREPLASVLQPGRAQLAAGFLVYGPQTALALTLGGGTHLFVFSARLGAFVEAADGRAIPEETQEFAINASNYRHWDEAVRLYVDDCLKGAAGPRGKDFNMRWIASLVAEAWRILVRGGVFLYPGDARKGYAQGRLRLVYEGNPIALLVEQAGGAATDGVRRLLDIVPSGLHQRTPLVFGSAREVARIGRYHTEPSVIAERAPLFGNRGLFRT